MGMGVTVTPDSIGGMLVALGIVCGLAGLIVGICELLYYRLSARVMLATSLAIFIVTGSPSLLQTVQHLTEVYHFDRDTFWDIIAFRTMEGVTFVVGLMACWTIIEMARRKLRLEELPPT
jgi:hypothetical protein